MLKIVCSGLLLAAALVFGEVSAHAQSNEILIGQTMPYSGPASSYGTIGRAEAAYFAKINAEGGVNGRKIRLISLDDSYSPPKTIEQTRRLVEQEKVLLIYGSFGTPTNAVIKKYLNINKVPHLFVTGGAVQWNDPQSFPWTFGWQPNYHVEMKIYTKYALEQVTNPKVGILYQNDDVGRDNLKGIREALGNRASEVIVKEVSYESTDPTIDSQVISLKESGANIFFNTGAGKFAAQAIRKAADLGWKPLQFVSNYSSSVGAVMKPAGLENAKNIISSQLQKDPTDAAWKHDEELKDWTRWMDQYYPSGDKSDIFNVYGYTSAMTLIEVLKLAGDNLSRDNIRTQAEKLSDLKLPMLLPGITINTSPTNHLPIQRLYLMKFNGASWEIFGDSKG